MSISRVWNSISQQMRNSAKAVASLKNPVTMYLFEDVIGDFKGMVKEAGAPYQSLINLYIRDGVTPHRRIQIAWQLKLKLGG